MGMHRKTAHSVAFTLSAILACAGFCTAAPPAQTAQTRMSAEQACDSTPLWRINDDDSVLYLFGTLHVLPENKNWVTPLIRTAMAQTPVTIFEIAPEAAGDETEMMRLLGEYGLNANGAQMADLVGEARWARFARIARGIGIDPAAMQTYRPWLALVVLTASALENAGYQSEFGAEKVIQTAAEQEEDSLQGLESLRDQISALASLDDQTMLEHFDSSLDEIENIKPITDNLMRAWCTGDADLIYQLAVQDLAKTAPAAYKALFLNRNRAWTVQIEQMLNGSGSHFIAVGAGHLVGPDSIINMLQDDQLTIERLQ